MTNECAHGHLARSCELCERDTEIASLRCKNKELRGMASISGASISLCREHMNRIEVNGVRLGNITFFDDAVLATVLYAEELRAKIEAVEKANESTRVKEASHG